MRVAFERRGRAIQTVTVDFEKLPAEAATGYAGLLRTPALPAGPVRVSLARIDAALLRGRFGRDSYTLLSDIVGPLADRRAEASRESTAGERLWAQATSHPALERHARLGTWLGQERSAGRACLPWRPYDEVLTSSTSWTLPPPAYPAESGREMVTRLRRTRAHGCRGMRTRRRVWWRGHPVSVLMSGGLEEEGVLRRHRRASLLLGSAKLCEHERSWRAS